jgi:hypothetical protein
MYLEEEAIDYFRNVDILEDFPAVLPAYRGGQIPSRRLGRNLEFEQYREYTPGDEFRDIDWKVFARNNKLFVKNYGSDIVADFRIILDNSQSMDYPEGISSKLSTAKKITAILSYLLINKRNRVSISVLNQTFTDYGRIHKDTLEKTLSEIGPSGKTDPGKISLEPNKEIVFLISDGWWRKPDSKGALDFLVQNRIHWMQVLSEEEIYFSIHGNLEIEDKETNKSFVIVPAEIRKEYAKIMADRLKIYNERLSNSGLLYQVFPLNLKYYISLKTFLELSKGRRASFNGAAL